MVTQYAKKNILGNSNKITKINDDDFDIFFYTVGWESRFAEIINRLGDSFKPEKNYILAFKFEKEDGFDIDKKNKFIEGLKVHLGTVPELIEFEYSEFEKFGEQINDLIYSELDIKKRPLKIGFEMSSCPRYYFLYILGLCISKNYTSSLSFFYSEGEYLDNFDNSDFNDILYSCDMETTIIPNAGSPTREGKVAFIFSLGFESNFVIDVISKNDPDYVVFLCAIPGYIPAYDKKVKDEISRVVDFCELNNGMYIQIDAAAGDAINAWKQLEEKTNSSGDNVDMDFRDLYTVHYAIGTKPQCLAMLLQTLVNDNMVVKYRISKRYKKIDVKPNDVFWRYDITNLRVI